MMYQAGGEGCKYSRGALMRSRTKAKELRPEHRAKEACKGGGGFKDYMRCVHNSRM